MSGHKPNDPKNNPASDPHKERGEKETTNRHVYVEPGVQIDFVKDFRQEYKTAQSENTAHNKKQLFWTKVSAGMLFIYVGLTLWQARSGQKSLEAVKQQFQLDRRPYISATTFHIMDDITGKPKENQEKTEIGKPLFVNIDFKNVGKSPAVNAVFHYHLLFGENVRNFHLEATDKGKYGITIDPGGERTVTATSIVDTYKRESADLNLADVIKWDGSEPIIVFGRVSYQDTSGVFYCTPYLIRRTSSNWGYVSDMSIAGTSILVNDLCKGN